MRPELVAEYDLSMLAGVDVDAIPVYRAPANDHDGFATSQPWTRLAAQIPPRAETSIRAFWKAHGPNGHVQEYVEWHGQIFTVIWKWRPPRVTPDAGA